jgi:hypothetical protein
MGFGKASLVVVWKTDYRASEGQESLRQQLLEPRDARSFGCCQWGWTEGCTEDPF